MAGNGLGAGAGPPGSGGRSPACAIRRLTWNIRVVNLMARASRPGHHRHGRWRILEREGARDWPLEFARGGQRYDAGPRRQ